MTEIRNTGKEIAQAIHHGHIRSDEAYEWLAIANVNELKEYLRWMPISNLIWSQHGRDALNVVLATENIKLQKEIRDLTVKMKEMTIVVIVLTVVIVFLTFIQACPIIKPFFQCSKSPINIHQPEKAINQSTETKQIQNNNSQLLEKNKAKK